jgi:hypothetical protein
VFLRHVFFFSLEFKHCRRVSLFCLFFNLENIVICFVLLFFFCGGFREKEGKKVLLFAYSVENN